MTASALNGQLPQYIGSTGGLLNSAETEEKYAITWTSNSAQAFPKTLPEGQLIVLTHHRGRTVLQQLLPTLKPVVKVIQQRGQQRLHQSAGVLLERCVVSVHCLVLNHGP